MDTEEWMEDCIKKLQFEDQEKLELAYGVEIEADAVLLACRIILQYPDVFQFDSRGVGDTQKEILQIKVVELLEEACVKLRNKFEYSRQEEDDLDVFEYLLRRTLVELNEIRKERDPSTQKWSDRVTKEHEDLKGTWNQLEMKWMQLQISRQRYDIRAREALLLERMHERLVFCINEARLKKVNTFSGMLQWIDDHVTELLYTTRKDFRHELTVSSHVIVKAASPLIDAPPPWLLSEPPLLQSMEQRIAKRVVGQEHILLAVTAALSRQRCQRRRRPIGSFLFMCGSGHGRTEIAKALAELLFGDKDMITEFDLAKHTGPNSLSRLIGVRSSHIEPGMKGELSESVKKRPLGVLLFDNVDKAHVSIIDILAEIIGSGYLSDGQGNTVDFTKTLVIMTTNVGCDKFWPWHCKCADEVQKFPVKEGLYDDAWETKHNYCYLSLLRETKQHFRPQLLENVDDVIAFRSLSFQQLKAVARLQLRDIASCMTQKGLIIYPYEAALDIIVQRSNWLGDGISGGEKIRMWLEENLVPVLFEKLAKNGINDFSIIYIEASAETNHLSFSWANGRHSLEEQDVNQLASLRELRLMYRKEKERAKNVYILRKIHNKLITSANAELGHAIAVVQELINTIQDLVTIPSSIKSFLDNPKMVAMAALNEDELRQNKRAKK